MTRRNCLATMLLLFSAGKIFAATLKKFVFRIKTKDGNIVGNVLIEAKDIEAAKVKLMKRYPGCTILNVETK